MDICQEALYIEDYIIDVGFKYVGRGKGRKVFKKNEAVVKVPYTIDGLQANKSEDFVYSKTKDKRLAPCKLIKDRLLIMKAVLVLDDLDPVQAALIPQWAYDIPDGPQVGMMKNGKILVYDYAELDLRFEYGGNSKNIKYLDETK